ncbi:MAG: hypothetical protein BGO32_00785 [Bacteroidetes bacterium 37-13]|nr:MAG: hypothetical protein BGO32_00785 [Bacteroidetes bacterium 37-13]
MPKNTIVILLIILLANTLTAQTTVAIIGGGMAGISSAHYILQYDSTAKITIYEKEKVTDGNAKTVEVLNASQQKIKVDIGPQYFIEGPWNDYIEFLNETLGETPYDFESLSG